MVVKLLRHHESIIFGLGPTDDKRPMGTRGSKITKDTIQDEFNASVVVRGEWQECSMWWTRHEMNLLALIIISYGSLCPKRHKRNAYPADAIAQGFLGFKSTRLRTAVLERVTSSKTSVQQQGFVLEEWTDDRINSKFDLVIRNAISSNKLRLSKKLTIGHRHTAVRQDPVIRNRALGLPGLISPVLGEHLSLRPPAPANRRWSDAMQGPLEGGDSRRTDRGAHGARTPGKSLSRTGA
ncbi:hypothetical protein BC827DRAFT_1157287 [Russula dissimulans]|nr:hypothetical protein BC827DRAFT_1157287 [Russula dissimulans]